jgi:hypothetical protein
MGDEMMKNNWHGKWIDGAVLSRPLGRIGDALVQCWWMI